ncbi:endolytic transglycosylase MltG [Streptomyces sp. V4-01]|uniref:Endolytic murein transglycosylase n=1 Tax=Actinacidiphila polyblastidii TaxID=3110430 RepID=A0ABU7PAQ2_9ACTN|nr:endolytic transglycosylase MltG [Streptomyces sp. V4-01]
MTDYGRGSGSEPWHPEDPLFGDVYEQGYQAQGHPGQGHPGEGYQDQGYPQQSQAQQPAQQQGGWQDPYATGQHQQQYPQQGQHPQGQGGYPQPPQQQYPQQGQHPQAQQQYPQHPQHPQQGQQQYPQAGYEGYDTGSYATGGYGHQDPYGGHQPQDPYGSQQDFYGQNGYPPPQQPQQPQYRQQPQQPQQPQQGMPQGGMPPQQQGMPGQPGPMQPGGPQQAGVQGRTAAPGQGGRPQEPAARPLRTAPEETGDWNAGEDADPREHAFFASRDDEDDEDDAPAGQGGRRAGKSGPKGGKKRRSGCACLVVAAVLVGGVGGAGYFGYSFYESHFGPAPDFSGDGSGDVQVEVPQGASLNTIGNILKKAGVVKSVDAFASAAGKNPKGRSIQPGIYVLKRQMASAAAVTLMLDPKSQSAMIVREGERDKDVYKDIDQHLGITPGTTERVAKAQWRTFGLPAWANSAPHIKDPLEGFLFPSRYSAAKGVKPEAVLKQMVGQAKEQYAQFDLAAEAKKQGLATPLQLLTVASLAQAEGKSSDDFAKMAKVVYNRRDPSNPQTYGFLQFDSTYNYARNISATNISLAKIRSYDDPYNTYKYKGLPPGPIGNPGLVALKAAMNPDPGNWYYFISLDNDATKFTETKAEFDKLYNQYNRQ